MTGQTRPTTSIIRTQGPDVIGASLRATGLTALLDYPGNEAVADQLMERFGWSAGFMDGVRTGRRTVVLAEAQAVADALGRPVSDLFTIYAGPSYDDRPYPELDTLPLVLTVAETAALLKISPDLVRDYCLSGRLPHIMLGDRRRIPRHVIHRMLTDK